MSAKVGMINSRESHIVTGAIQSARFLIAAIFLLGTTVSPAIPAHCDVCGGNFGANAFTVTDQVDQRVKWVCESCADLTTVCYQCGVPVWKDYLTLPDGRILCPRDQVGIVLDEDEALAVCRDVNRTLERLLGRFTAFPSTNLHVRLADRVDVRALVGVAGYDFSCPNLLGYTLSLQRSGYQTHEIRLLSGLQKGVLQSTYAHELAHAWVAENLSKARELELRGDAAEGFCELIAFLTAETYRDETAQRLILSNQYTRGQLPLFIEGSRRFGMGDVFDWMQYGGTTVLRSDTLEEIREVSMPAQRPSRPVSEILYIPKTPPKRDESLKLTSITIGPMRSIATINQRAFEVNETREVPLALGNVVLRCVEINSDSVLLEDVHSGKRERLSLGATTNALTGGQSEPHSD